MNRDIGRVNTTAFRTAIPGNTRQAVATAPLGSRAQFRSADTARSRPIQRNDDGEDKDKDRDEDEEPKHVSSDDPDRDGDDDDPPKDDEKPDDDEKAKKAKS